LQRVPCAWVAARLLAGVATTTAPRAGTSGRATQAGEAVPSNEVNCTKLPMSAFLSV
jgi:hypothetical protein